jgi:hypothetical protein
VFINVTDMMLSDDEAWSRWKLVFIHRMAGTIVLSTALHTVAVRIDSARIRPRPFKIWARERYRYRTHTGTQRARTVLDWVVLR